MKTHDTSPPGQISCSRKSSNRNLIFTWYRDHRVDVDLYLIFNIHVIELIAYYCCCVIIDVGAHTQDRNKGVCIGGKKTLDLRYVFLAETETEITNFLVVRKFKKI